MNSTCSCTGFFKHHNCKHIVAICARLRDSDDNQIVTIPLEAKTVPINECRGRGRPILAKKALVYQPTKCLIRPEPVEIIEIIPEPVEIMPEPIQITNPIPITNPLPITITSPKKRGRKANPISTIEKPAKKAKKSGLPEPEKRVLRIRK